jgi:hypothetical protein
LECFGTDGYFGCQICSKKYEFSYHSKNSPGRSGNTWQIVNDGIYALAGSMSGWLKTGSASAIIMLLTSGKNCSQPTKIARRKKLLTKFAHNEQIYCEQKFTHGESNLLMENQICSRRINFAHGES